MKTEAELFAWLEKQYGCALVNDDNGHWACVFDGIQNVPDTDGPADISTSFWIKADEWKDTIREAIEHAMADEEKSP